MNPPKLSRADRAYVRKTVLRRFELLRQIKAAGGKTRAGLALRLERRALPTIEQLAERYDVSISAIQRAADGHVYAKEHPSDTRWAR